MLRTQKYRSRNMKKKKLTMGIRMVLAIIVLIMAYTYVKKLTLYIDNNTKEQEKIIEKKDIETIKKLQIVKVEKEKQVQAQALAIKQLAYEKANNTFNEPSGEFAPWKSKRTDGKKIVYLTFDDGPSENTASILQVLNQNSIKATFFLIGKNAEKNSNLVKQEVNEGNVVGNHTYSHSISYREGPKKFLDDVVRCDQVLKSILGNQYKSKLMRFPGGYFGHGNKLDSYKDAITEAGYTYVDWNDEIGDADAKNPPVMVLMNNLKVYTVSASSNSLVVLMHDAGPKKNTVQALPQVIQYLKENGYTFDTIH